MGIGTSIWRILAILKAFGAAYEGAQTQVNVAHDLPSDR
jgi:hypothetical protein